MFAYGGKTFYIIWQNLTLPGMGVWAWMLVRNMDTKRVKWNFQRHLISWYTFNKLTSFFLCVGPHIDDKLRHNIHLSKCCRSTSRKRVDQTANFDYVMTKFIINKRTDASKTDVNLFFTITKSQNWFSNEGKKGKSQWKMRLAAESEFHRYNSENHRLVN